MPGPRWARTATDLVAGVAVGSFIAAFWWDGVVVAVFALVLLGVTVPRVAGLPGVVQAATGATLILGAWAATLEWYARVPGLDLLIHAVANGLLALVAVLVMVRYQALAPLSSRLGAIIVTAGVGALLGVIWEAGEWFGHTYLNDAIGVGYDDTVGDLAAGTVGSALAGATLGAVREDDDE